MWFLSSPRTIEEIFKGYSARCTALVRALTYDTDRWAMWMNSTRSAIQDWLSLVAVHNDCWLLSVAFYFGARLNRNES
ncbi:hypothetical protein NL676_010586 [Syzygium grande]|nr:hypothetical protein NL676_010586 [Syzygium grande]